MAIELFFSNELVQLADKLSDIVADENRSKANIFNAPVVIVPNANLAKWLQLFLAKRNSIFMNIDFQYLEAGLWDMIAALDSGKNKPEMLDNDLLKILLVHALQNLKGNVPDLLPVTRYLMREDGHQNPDYAARLWQLSEKLAHLFREYEFHRIGMIQNWLAGTAVQDSMERCQQQLYLKLKTKRNGLESRTGKKLLSMMEYADKVLSESGPGAEKAADNKFIHFFGLSQISDFHLKLIGRLQDYYTVFIYALNPSKEFWEDIKTPGEKRWVQRKNIKGLAIRTEEKEQGELFQYDDNPLLAAWGKPGRESVRLLCELTDYDFNACFTTQKPATGILQRIQNDIFTLSSAVREAEAFDQDRSLQIIACPSVYREVETVYNSILFNLEQNSDLQLTDIAILVPDISTYKPVFDAVFNRNPRCLDYNLVDSHAEIESVYGKAILSILTLVTGRFSRNEVFDLIMNPCFASRWKIGQEEVQAWAGWAEALNVFHTFDRETKTARGYPASGTYTWKQGLQRLRLSRIMAAPNAPDTARLWHFQELVPFNDEKTGDVDLVEKFCMVIEALHHAVNAFNVKNATGEQWKQVFFGVCDQLIEIPEDFKGEFVVQQTLINAFDNLVLYDRLQGDASETTLDVDLIKEFIRANLSAISGGHGDYLTGGVTISALQPMRPIPFRIVYVLGMEEGNFPGRAELSSLDLRLLKRRIGDISLPERNCYLFLEVLLTVQDKMYICYVSRDLQKDRIRQPCSVVNQLRRYVEQEVFTNGQRFQIMEIPLSGSSKRFLDPEAINTWSDVLINYSTADRLACYRANRLWEKFNQSALADDLKRLERFNPDWSVDVDKPAAGDRQVERITSKQLKKFLEDPVRQKTQRHLGLYDEEETIEDLILREDEPFFSEFPLDYHLKTDPVRQWLDMLFSSQDTDTARPAPEDIYNLVYDQYRRKSRTPEGAFAEMDRNELRGHVCRIVETLNPVLDQMQSARKLYRAVFIGEQTGEPIPSGINLGLKRFEPLSMTVQTVSHTSEDVTCDVELHGQLPWVWQDAESRWHALVLTGSRRKPKEPDKYVFEPVIFYLLCLSGENSCRWIGTSGITFHIVYRERLVEWTYNFDQETARMYLNDLVSDYLNQSLAVWLPFEIISKLPVRPHKVPDDAVDDLIREQFFIELEGAYSEVDDYLVRITKPAVPLDAFDRVRGRFKIFFDIRS
ncbi:MAG: exodeoxyribonuclease V subunit gamma [Desulfobacterales bacterium]